MMNPLIPLFVIVPLAGAFLIMILGRFVNHINKVIASSLLLFMVIISIWCLVSTGDSVTVYKVGGWEPVNKIPVGIYMVLDAFSSIMLCIINILGFLSVIYAISYISRYTSENYF